MEAERVETVHVGITVFPGAGGDDSNDFAAMLRRMYRCWAIRHGILEGEDGGMIWLPPDERLRWEVGVHRLIRSSPFDRSRRRHTAFAEVRVGNWYAITPDNGPPNIRSYTLNPSTRVKDHRTGDEHPDAHSMFDGLLELLQFPPTPQEHSS